MNIPGFSDLAGQSTTTEKLTFTPMSRDLKTKFTDKSFSVLFNPNTYSISKTVSWSSIGSTTTAVSSAGNSASAAAPQEPQSNLDAPTLNFRGGQNRQLSLNLFYDVTEQPGTDVRSETSKIVALTKIDRDEQCPLPCEISWGNSQNPYDFPFTGVITNLSQQFTLFSADGLPLRANLTVTVMEYPDPEKNLRETDPELTTRMIKRGDTLSSISAEMYGDPTMWRLIAEANRIEDPRVLKTGVRLTIPKVE